MKIANHSEPLLKMNLQFFADDEDVILPDDFEPEAPPEVEEQDDLETVDPVEEPTDPVVEPQKLKIKYNHEEQEITLDEAVELAQKGKNYDKLQQRLQELETDPRLSFIEELAKEQGMNVNEFMDAMKQHREQEKLNQLIQQNIPEDMAREILENRKFREQFESQRKQQSEQQKQNEEYTDFLTYFKQANDRDFDTSKDQIPNEVWEAHSKGVPLKFAYMEHQTKQYQQQLKVLKQNETNAQRAPIKGGVTNHGSQETASEDDFLAGFNSI